MREEFLTTKEFSKLTGRSKEAIYSQKHRDFKRKENLKRYKIENGKTLYSTREFYINKKLQEDFEMLYYSLIDNYKSQLAFSKALAMFLNKSPNTINMYFRDCFFSEIRLTAKKDYVLAMRNLQAQ